MKALLPLALVLGLTGLSGAHAAETLDRAGPPEKVCQLTGEIDWQTGKPTQAQTMSRFGLEGADLGYPIEHNGKLILLFGDSWPTLQKPSEMAEAPPNDAVGIVTAKTTPTSATCLGMTINDVPGTTMQPEGKGPLIKVYQPSTVVSPGKIQQGFFDVPSGGVSVGGALYGFFWTDHCAKGHALPMTDAPLSRPAGDDRCPETDALNSIGRGVMARSDDDGRTFHDAKPMPPGFGYAIAVNAATEGDPEAGDHGIVIFGVPRYRASVPYMARALPENFADPHRWLFLAGRDASGKPQWISYQDWAGAYALKGPSAVAWHPPGKAQTLFDGEGGKEACIGEFSITWNAPLKKWLMAYNCHGIEARVADEPWGPWSAPTVLLSGKDDLNCKVLMDTKGCNGRKDFWPYRRTGKDVVTGGLYAPFVLNRYTQAGKVNQAVIYWLLSTWNPYEVDVMRSTIRIH